MRLEEHGSVLGACDAVRSEKAYQPRGGGEEREQSAVDSGVLPSGAARSESRAERQRRPRHRAPQRTRRSSDDKPSEECQINKGDTFPRGILSWGSASFLCKK